MPIARFEMPDGKIARFEVPDGTTPEQAQVMIQQSLPDVFGSTDGKTESFKRGQAEENYLVRGLTNAINGPLMGFGDEVIGAGQAVVDKLTGAPGSLAENYQQRRDFLRGVQDAYTKENPILGPATQMMTSAPMLTQNLAGNAAAKVAPQTVAKYGAWLNAPRAGLPAIGARSVNAGLNGAVYGALGGMGTSEADTALGVALDTAKGAATGGALGAATPVAGAMAMGGYNQAATRLSNSSAASYAKQKVAEALSRDGRGAVFESGASNAGAQAAARFDRLGPEARIVDAGGQNTRQLLDTTATLPGRTKNLVENAIHERQATRGDRLISAADQALGNHSQRLQTTLDDLVAKRSMSAAPIYNDLYKRGTFIDSDLRGIIDAAEKLGAGAAAKRIATAKQIPYSLSTGTQWSGFRELDYLKQGLDDIIAANIKPDGGLTKVGAAVQGLKKELVGRLDALSNGKYKAARDAFAGPSALIDAATAGRRALTMDDQMIGKELAGLSTSEAEAFRLGAFEALRAKLGNMSGQNQLLNLWRDKGMQEKLKALFGDERSYRDFATKLAQEGRMKGLEAVGRGSQTAARQYGAGDLDVAPMMQAVTAASQGSPTGLLNAGLGMWNRVRTPEPVRDQIGGLLLSRDPALMQELSLLTPLLTAERNQRAATSGRFAGLLAQ